MGEKMAYIIDGPPFIVMLMGIMSLSVFTRWKRN